MLNNIDNLQYLLSVLISGQQSLVHILSVASIVVMYPNPLKLAAHTNEHSFIPNIPKMDCLIFTGISCSLASARLTYHMQRKGGGWDLRPGVTAV